MVNLGSLVIYARRPFEELELVSDHRCVSRAFDLPHPFPEDS